jgi:alkylation response protein AidB-like acyl-CoA dehydrogenase
VRFDSVELPGTAVVGTGDATEAVERQLQQAIAVQCAEAVGATSRAFEMTVEWAFDRYSFGRPLASYQALKHRFADLMTWVESAHAATTAAVRAVGHNRHDAALAASVAKAYVGERCPEIVQDCIQLHGGIGVTWDHDLHLFLRRVTLARALYGAPAEHLHRIAALTEREAA